MKKFIALALCTLSLVSLVACGKFECDLCKEEKTGKRHKEELLGEEIVICDECYKDLEALGELLS